MAAKKKPVKSKATVKKKAATKKKPVKSAVRKKTSAKKTPARKAAKKSTPRKTSAKKTAVKKSPAKKSAARKATAKKSTVKISAARKSTAKKPVAKKSGAKKQPHARKKASVKSLTARTGTRKGGASQVGPVPGIAPYKEKRGEEYMGEKQEKHFSNILLAWKRELMEEVDRTVHHMQDDAANFPDPNDRATQESEFSMELRTRDRERKLIKKIDEALRKLDNNDYGYCEACGVEIGVKRLEARPTATLCIDCKILDEIRERQMG